MDSIFYLSAVEISKMIKSGKLSASEIIEKTFERIEKINPLINAFISLRYEGALKDSRFIDEQISRGQDPGPLCGVPVGVKDLEDVRGMVTSYGSVPFKNNVAKHDSIQVERLRDAGAIIIGKTNTPEFGYTGFTKNRLFGVTKNPWNTDLTPGGSSGGSGSAVCAGMVPIATGSDAGGSIRIPACYCGCFGFKPTYGRVPIGPMKHPFMMKIWTLGPITRTVEDASIYMDSVSGFHRTDPDSLSPPRMSYQEAIKNPPAKLRIAYSEDLGYARVQKEIKEVVDKAIKRFRDAGYEIEPWEDVLPELGDEWLTIASCEIYSQIYTIIDECQGEIGRSLFESLERVRKISLDELIQINKRRDELRRKVLGIFSKYHILITPAMPTEPFSAKGPPPAEVDGHPIPLLGAVAFTYPFNLTGNPCSVVRAGLTPSGLPAGIQIVGPIGREELVFQVSKIFEDVNPWNNQWPDL